MKILLGPKTAQAEYFQCRSTINAIIYDTYLIDNYNIHITITVFIVPFLA